MSCRLVYDYAKSLLDYAADDLKVASHLLELGLGHVGPFMAAYFLHQSAEKASKALLALFTGALIAIQGFLTRERPDLNRGLKAGYLELLTSVYLNKLTGAGERQEVKLTDLEEVLKEELGHDERKIFSVLNDINEDLTDEGRVTLLLKEALKGLTNTKGDFFAVLKGVFDPYKRESLGYSRLNMDREEVERVRGFVERLEKAFNGVLELLNEVQAVARIRDPDGRERHINEAARYPIISERSVLTRGDLMPNRHLERERLVALSERVKEVIGLIEGLLKDVRECDSCLGSAFRGLLELVLA